MKTLKFTVLTALVLALANSGTVLAEFDPQQFAAQFNGSDGKGWQWNIAGYKTNNSSSYNEYYIGGGNLPDLRAYSDNTKTSDRFYTFCAEPNVKLVAVNTSGYAKLNYQDGRTKNSDGMALNLGAAWLYTQYATGQLSGFDYTGSKHASDVNDLGRAITLMMGGINGTLTTQQITNNIINNNGSTGEKNKYLELLRTSNDYTASEWASDYIVSADYKGIGDYAVFVMNMTEYNGRNLQDYLYVVCKDHGDGGDDGGGCNDVPEPATFLLWTLSGIGLAGASWVKKRRLMKLALA
ncbi:MAG: PEP-CTERM sorting domain-containing protein [Planctomycetaceae bacterium]|nr:PEP-CTERM sorting domain-containing protein [Planctomycetaceae bacterium]